MRRGSTRGEPREAGGEAIIENPPDFGVREDRRRDVVRPALWTYSGNGSRPKWFAEEQWRHRPLWELPWTVAWIVASKSRKLQFAQCRLGSKFKKATWLFVTPKLCEVARTELAPLTWLQCECTQKVGAPTRAHP